MKAFLLLLWLTPVIVTINLAPVSSFLWLNFEQAHRISRSDPIIRKNWWDWKGSWFVCAGPIGRYARGLCLGYRILAVHQNQQIGLCSIEKASFSNFFLAVLSLALAVFTLVLAAITTWNILRGVSPVEGLRNRTGQTLSCGAAHSKINVRSNLVQLLSRPLFLRRDSVQMKDIILLFSHSHRKNE